MIEFIAILLMIDLKSGVLQLHLLATLCHQALQDLGERFIAPVRTGVDNVSICWEPRVALGVLLGVLPFGPLPFWPLPFCAAHMADDNAQRLLQTA